MDKQNEKLLEAICQKVWQDTYRHSESDDAALAMCARLAIDSSEPGDSDHSNFMYTKRLLFVTKWLHCGRVQLVVGHKYAAALMSSAVADNLSEDLILPWKAFVVDLPTGLLQHGGLVFERIEVASYDGELGCQIGLQGSRFPKTETSGEVQFVKMASDPATMFFKKEADETLSDAEDGNAWRDMDVKERAMRMAVRLVVGLLYTMQHTNNFRERVYGDDRGSNRSGPPPHRVFLVGRPMAIDCRPDVARYMSGGAHAPPSVQSLVRGHYKRQVIGVGRAGRKVIWVEPYWRGPEDAPILTRPLRVGPADPKVSA